MASESEYVNEYDSYESQINAYKQQALTLWSGLENAAELPKQIAGEIGSTLTFEYGKGGVSALLNSKAAQAAKGRLVQTYENVKGAVGRGFDRAVQQAREGIADFTDTLTTGVDDAVSTVQAGAADAVAQVSGQVAQGAQDGAASIADGVQALANEGQAVASDVSRAVTGAVDAGVRAGTQAATDVADAGLQTGLQFADNGARLAAETGRSVSSYGAETLAESKSGGGLLRTFMSRLSRPRVTANGRVNTALGADEFEDGAYSLVDQPGRALSSSRSFTGLVSDGYGTPLGSTTSNVAGEGAASVVTRTVRPLTVDVPDTEAIPQVGEAVKDAASQAVSDVVNADRVAATVADNVAAVEQVTGAGLATAQTALETGATAIQGGTRLIGGAAAEAGAVAANTSEAVGSTVAETTGEVLDALGPETFGLSDVAGLALGLGGVLYSIFGGHEEPPTINIPNYSTPAEALGLGR